MEVVDNEMTNIIDQFTLPDAFSTDEELALIETAFTLINELIGADPMMFIQPDFHERVIGEVTELLTDQLAEVFDYALNTQCKSFINNAPRNAPFIKHLFASRRILAK